MHNIKRYLSKNNFVVGLIILVFILEFIATVYLEFSSNSKTRFVGIYKILFLLIIFFFSKLQKLKKIDLILLLSLVLITVLNQFFFSPIFFENLEFNLLKGSIYYVFRYLYIFIFIMIFINVKDYKIVALKALKIIEFLLIINAFLILVGSVFDINLLASYPNSIRFGSDGLFNKVNETSYLYMIYILSLYYNYLLKKKNILKLIFIILISLLIGTKTIILFLALLLTFHIIFVVKINKYIKFFFGVSALLFVVFFKKIAELYFSQIKFWNILLEEHNVTSLLFSKRDYLLKNNLEYIDSNWNFINFLIGGSYYDKNFEKTQMDGPDLFIFFGLIGLIVYAYLFSKNYFSNNNYIYNVGLVIILICAIISGGLFLSVMPMIYIYMLKVSLEKSSRHF
ncbi:MAG: hypothetical protein EVB12_00640 [Winogradskyella sp.]|nr:MAG: hypothetical protein EVB12_00640 [Winogradskyella sp.]